MGGLDKGLQLLAERPLIEWVVTAIRPQVETITICANRNVKEYMEYAPIVMDKPPGFMGPLAGIAAALEHMHSDWVLTVPVDCPQPPADLALRLYSSVGSNRGTVAHDGTRRQPLFALYPRALAPLAMQALHGHISVWRFQDNVGMVEVDFSDAPSAFTNLNTLAELIAYKTSDHERH